jgi:anaerobic ribonucleoside-triphosphate reductase activating protein
MAGREADPAEITAKALRNPLVEGLTITGGEPFEQPEEAGALAASAKAAGLSVITYTGYLWEELLPRLETGKLLKNSDYIVDGPYMEPQRSLALDFRGSRNQRVIDVKASLAAGKVVLAGETWGAPIGAELRNGRG